MRPDLSDYLVHWTRGASDEEAFARLGAIVRDGYILGGCEHRKGHITSVCFTEAPTEHFQKAKGRYSFFGVRVSKRWAFARGARPVIYQRDSEFELLPDSLRWRHVRYEPDADPAFDFTWEREWRVPVEKLGLEASDFSILLPHADWLENLKRQHESRESWRIFGEAEVYGDWYAWQRPRAFLFHVQFPKA
jgi:hypothetical protein